MHNNHGIFTSALLGIIWYWTTSYLALVALVTNKMPEPSVNQHHVILLLFFTHACNWSVQR